MRILFLGTGAFGRPALVALRAAGHDIVRVVSQPDRPAGRGRAIAPTPLRAAAEELQLPHIQAADVNALDPAGLAGGVELGVVVDFGQKLGPALLAQVQRGVINIHGSLLPKYRGAAPIQWAILNGDAHTGVTVFQLNERWDAGAILGRRATAIDESETADELHDRLAALGAELVVDVVAGLERGTLLPEPQEHAAASRAPKLTKADGRLDWTAPAAVVVRRIHGLWSWPGAVCELASRSGRRERVQLVRARLIDDSTPASDSAPGTILPDRSVQCGRGRLHVLEIRPAGGRLMTFDAYSNGRRIAVGDAFVSLAEEAP